jgi:phosphoglycerate kinase
MILGGVDLGKKAEMFGRLLRVTDQALVCGSVGLTFLKARLVAVGSSIVEPQQEVTAFQLQEKSELEQTVFAGPMDHVIAERFTRDAKTKTVKDIPDRWMALDIGPKTISSFEKYIKSAKSILWYGTAGAIEVPAFQTGTVALLKAASKSQAHITFIGRDTCRMAEDFSFQNASFLPASEPALEILSGKIPAGLQILQKEI